MTDDFNPRAVPGDNLPPESQAETDARIFGDVRRDLTELEKRVPNYLQAKYGYILARMKELMASAAQLPKTITDEATAEKASLLRCGEISGVMAEADTARKPEKKAWDDVGKAIHGWFTKPSEDIEKVSNDIKPRLEAWQFLKAEEARRKAEEEQRKREEEAKRLREEQEKKEREAEEARRKAAEEKRRAEEAEQRRLQAIKDAEEAAARRKKAEEDAAAAKARAKADEEAREEAQKQQREAEERAAKARQEEADAKAKAKDARADVRSADAAAATAGREERAATGSSRGLGAQIKVTEREADRHGRVAAAPLSDLSRVRSAEGSVSSLQTFWTFKDMDRTSIDLEALRPHFKAEDIEAALTRYIAAGNRSIKGATIWEDARDRTV